MTAQVVGRNSSGWLAAFWRDGDQVVSRVIATPERDFKAGLLITWGWVTASRAPYASFAGDVYETLASCARYNGYEPVPAGDYPLRAYCNVCGEAVSLAEGDNCWHHDQEPGSHDLTPYRKPQPLPGGQFRVGYLSVAGVAAHLGMKPATLAQAIWRNQGDHPAPVPDVEIEPGHGGPDRGWSPGRLPEWEAWRASLPGRGAGGGRPRKEHDTAGDADEQAR